jgi:type VI secretion system secreted protein Hcp
MNKFLKLEGVSQGLIKGPVTQLGREGTINVLYYSHDVSAPLDINGVPSGKIRYNPLILIKSIDRSTPLLYKALAINETMKTFNLAFYAKTATTEIQQFTIDLVNARIVSIIQIKENAGSTIDAIKFAEYEELHFLAQSIKWSWYDGPNPISYTTPPLF